eukprot:Em0948g1a
MPPEGPGGRGRSRGRNDPSRSALQMRSSSSHAGNADPADAGLRPSSTPACIRKRRNTRRTVDAGQPRVPAFQHQQGIRPQDADDGYRHRRGVKRRRAHHMDSSSRSGVGSGTRKIPPHTLGSGEGRYSSVVRTRHPFRAPSSLVPTPCNPLPPMEQPSLPKGVSPTHSQGRKSAGNSITAPAIVPSVPLPTSAGSRVALVTTLASPALELLQLQVDLKSAFRMVPVRSTDWDLLVMCWQGSLLRPYIGFCPPNSVEAIHYFDEFVLVGPAVPGQKGYSLSRDQMKVFLHFFQNRPVGERKYDYHRARLEVSVAQFIFGPLQSIRV